MDSRPLTIALVSTQRDWHGGEEQARLLIDGLRRRGHRCVVFARHGGAFAQRIEAEGVELFIFAGNGRSPAALWRMRRRLARLRPDVLHFNDSHALSGAGLAAWGLHIPAKIASRRVVFPLRSSWPYRKLCDRILCVSNATAQVCRNGGIPASMLTVVHDGVNPARVYAGDRRRGRQSLDLADDQTLLLCVAKLTDAKGHRFLLDALPAVLEKHPRAVLALAGDGELRQPLQDQANRLGVQSHVRFLGYRRDVPDLIHACDLFVLPSQSEGLCSTLIDVMLADRTIVTTSAGGIPDLIGPGSTDGEPAAWIVPPCDSAALTEAIFNALGDPQRNAAMRHLAKRRAESQFTADAMVESTLAAYLAEMQS